MNNPSIDCNWLRKKGVIYTKRPKYCLCLFEDGTIKGRKIRKQTNKKRTNKYPLIIGHKLCVTVVNNQSQKYIIFVFHQNVRDPHASHIKIQIRKYYRFV